MKEKKFREDEQQEFKNYDIILFGCNRVGYDFLRIFKKMRKKFLVIDYNPELIHELTKKKINCRYGDIDDNEFLDELNLNKIKMAVSTIPSFETNLLLINKIRQTNKKAIIMVVSHNIEEANILYGKGATYVVMPHFLGAEYTSMMINKYGLNINEFLKEKKKHLKQLKIKKRLGHEHPKAEKHR